MQVCHLELRFNHALQLALTCSVRHVCAATQGEWTAEEDEQLIALHDQCGNSWSQISKIIRGRTSQQCRGRFFQLSAKVS